MFSLFFFLSIHFFVLEHSGDRENHQDQSKDSEALTTVQGMKLSNNLFPGRISPQKLWFADACSKKTPSSFKEL